MPMTARSNYITMSPELLHKLESSTPNHGPDHVPNAVHVREGDNTNTLFNVLEKSIDVSKELIIPEQYRPEKPRKSEHYPVRVDSQDSTSSRDRTKSVNGSHSDSLNEDTSSVNLFDVSVDINENFPAKSDSSSDEDGTISLSSPTNTRRASHWRATVLFVASDVQLTVNLAELCLPDGFETAPQVYGSAVRCLGDTDGLYNMNKFVNCKAIDWFNTKRTRSENTFDWLRIYN